MSIKLEVHCDKCGKKIFKSDQLYALSTKESFFDIGAKYMIICLECMVDFTYDVKRRFNEFLKQECTEEDTTYNFFTTFKFNNGKSDVEIEFPPINLSISTCGDKKLLAMHYYNNAASVVGAVYLDDGKQIDKFLKCYVNKSLKISTPGRIMEDQYVYSKVINNLDMSIDEILDGL